MIQRYLLIVVGLSWRGQTSRLIPNGSLCVQGGVCLVSIPFPLAASIDLLFRSLTLAHVRVRHFELLSNVF